MREIAQQRRSYTITSFEQNEKEKETISFWPSCFCLSWHALLHQIFSNDTDKQNEIFKIRILRISKHLSQTIKIICTIQFSSTLTMNIIKIKNRTKSQQ